MAYGAIGKKGTKFSMIIEKKFLHLASRIESSRKLLFLLQLGCRLLQDLHHYGHPWKSTAFESQHNQKDTANTATVPRIIMYLL